MAERAAFALDPEPLLGTWHNTNAASPRIARIEIERDGAQIAVRAFAADEPEPRAWGPARGWLFAGRFEATRASAFSASLESSALEVQLQANLKGGVLVVAAFSRFRDERGSAGHFGREFYHRLPAPGGERP